MMNEILHHLQDTEYLHGELYGIPLYLTNHTLVMWVVSVLLVVLVGYVGWRFRRRVSPVPRGFVMNVIEAYVIYVRDELVYPIMGKKTGKKWLGFILTLFIFLLGCNLWGLVPDLYVPGSKALVGHKMKISGGATGNIWINGGLAVLVLFSGMIFGIKNHGVLGYIKNYVPHGVPLLLFPLLWPIEVFGTLIKHAVLAIRLFANMLAGHGVLFGVIGTAAIFVEMLGNLGVGFMASLAPIALGLLIYMLEILVAIIQAYVFSLLSVIFLDMQVSGH